MVYEIAEIDVTPGDEDKFIAAVEQAAPLFKAAKGCLSLALKRSVETPTRFRLFVGWESVEAHNVDFRGSEAFQQWRALVGRYFASPPRVDHNAVVLDLF